MIASVTRRSDALGPDHLDGGRIGRDLPDDESGGGLPLDRWLDRHDARRRRLEPDGDRRRRDLRHRDRKRRLHALGRQMKQPPARLGGAQIDGRHEIAGDQPAQRIRRAANAHVDRFLRRLHHFEILGRFCSSSGMRSPRSTDARCDDTISHSSTASATDTTFRPT